MTKQPAHLYEFGPFRLDVKERLLLKDGEPVSLTPRTFDVLAVLVREHGKLVTKNEFLNEVWPNSFVEETNLPQNVYLLRKALGDEEYNCPKFIETVTRHGYRFIADVKEVMGGDSELIIHQRTKAEILIEQEQEEGVEETFAMSPESRPLPSAPVPRPKARRVALLAFSLLAMLATLSYFLLRDRTDAGSTPKSVAVLPFKAIGAEEGHLGLGMTVAIITKLSSLRQFTVMPTSAVFKYADGEHDPLVAGHALGAEAILDGTVQRAGDGIRVTVRLIKVLDGESLWEETFDEKFTSIFSTQDVISERVAQAMRYRLTAHERQLLAKQPTNNVEAYEAYVRGVYFWNKRTVEGLRQSIRYFEHAVGKDPNYAPAFAGLSDSYAIVGYIGYNEIMPRREAFEKARETGRRALELDEGLAEAHTALAQVKAYYDDDLAGAEESLRHAVNLNPSYGTAHFRYSLLLLLLGRLDEARREATKAQELDPLSASINTNLGYMLYAQRDFDKAEVSCRKALETEPDFFTAQYHLGLIYIQKGRHDEAIEVLRKAAQVRAIRYEALEAIGYALAVSGRKGEAVDIIAEMEKAAASDKDVNFNIAVIHTGLGDFDRAFEYLGKMGGDLGLRVIMLRFDPRLEKLRADGQYAQIWK
ncbi:MAG TPA: winged helix-turn-helix domain-containing protein [Blastocatellia bacterium]|nr:winged helix-turn-helix domain-containing protein [Blastocatellia bacterium]